ncbi:MAG: hypothetical protein RDV41_15535 [Planctomycetota bacterium]|nr:hypothetical protein [Planctomycetota bacterium]
MKGRNPFIFSAVMLGACLVLAIGAVAASAEEAEPVWRRPIELRRSEGQMWTGDVLLSGSGSLVLVWTAMPTERTKDRLSAMRTSALVSDDRGNSWREFALPDEQVRPTAFEIFGDSLCYLAHGQDTMSFYVVDIKTGKGEKHDVFKKADIEGNEFCPEYSRLLFEGNKIFLVQSTEHPVHYLFTMSTDGGKTWEKPCYVAKELWQNDSMAPGFFISKDAPNVVYNLSEKQELEPHQARTADKGKTWEDREIGFGLEGSFTAHFDTAFIGKDICMSFMGGKLVGGEELAYFSTKSTDGGRSWTKPVKIGTTRAADLCLLYDLKAVDGRLFLTYTRSGKSDLYAQSAHVFMSKNGGDAWKELDITQNIARNTGMPVVTADPKTGEVYCVFENLPPEDEAKEGGNHFLLFRRAAKPDDPAGAAANADNVAAMVQVLVSDLDSSDHGTRERATSDLMALGEEAMAPIRKAIEETKSLEAKTRLERALARYSGEWWKGE